MSTKILFIKTSFLGYIVRHHQKKYVRKGKARVWISQKIQKALHEYAERNGWRIQPLYDKIIYDYLVKFGGLPPGKSLHDFLKEE